MTAGFSVSDYGSGKGTNASTEPAYGGVTVSNQDVIALATMVESEVGGLRSGGLGNVNNLVNSAVGRLAIDPNTYTGIQSVIDAPWQFTGIHRAGGWTNFYNSVRQPDQATIDAVRNRLAEISVFGFVPLMPDFGNPSNLPRDASAATRRAMAALERNNVSGHMPVASGGYHVYGARPLTQKDLVSQGITGPGLSLTVTFDRTLLGPEAEYNMAPHVDRARSLNTGTEERRASGGSTLGLPDDVDPTNFLESHLGQGGYPPPIDYDSFNAFNTLSEAAGKGFSGASSQTGDFGTQGQDRLTEYFNSLNTHSEAAGKGFRGDRSQTGDMFGTEGEAFLFGAGVPGMSPDVDQLEGEPPYTFPDITRQLYDGSLEAPKGDPLIQDRMGQEHGLPAEAPAGPVNPWDMPVGVPFPLEIEHLPGPGMPSIFGPAQLETESPGDWFGSAFGPNWDPTFVAEQRQDAAIADMANKGVTSTSPSMSGGTFNDILNGLPDVVDYSGIAPSFGAGNPDPYGGRAAVSSTGYAPSWSSADFDAAFAGFPSSPDAYDAIAPSFSAPQVDYSPPPSQTIRNADAVQSATQQRNDLIGQNALARAAASPAYTANPDWGLDSPKERNLAGVNAARAAGTFGTVPQPVAQVPAPRQAAPAPAPTKGQQYAAALSPGYASAAPAPGPSTGSGPSIFSANAQTTAPFGGFVSGGGQWVDTTAPGGSWNHGGGYGYNAPDGSYFAAGGDFISTPQGMMASYTDPKSGNYSPGELAQAQLAAGVFGPSLFGPPPGSAQDNASLGAFGDILDGIIAAAAADAFGSQAGYGGGYADPYGGPGAGSGGYGGYADSSGANWR